MKKGLIFFLIYVCGLIFLWLWAKNNHDAHVATAVMASMSGGPTGVDRELAEFMPGGCTVEQFMDERFKAGECLKTGTWSGRDTTCHGSCGVATPSTYVCTRDDIANTGDVQRSCTMQGGIWFPQHGALCFGECWWPPEHCFGKILEIMEMWQAGKQRGSQLPKPDYIDPISCDVNFPSEDH